VIRLPRAFWLASGITIAAEILLGCAGRSTPDVQVAPLSVVELGEGWAANTINTVIFRHHALVTSEGRQYGAYYDASGSLVVFERVITSNDVVKVSLPGSYSPTDAHNSISLGLDRDGYLHLSYAQHNGPLRYRRSTAPRSILAWTDEIPMTGAREDFVTYPTFLTPRGPDSPSLIFLYRDGSSASGTACMKVYRGLAEGWFDRDPCPLDGALGRPWSSGPYWNHPAFGQDGALHLSFTWRTKAFDAESMIINVGLNYALSPDYGVTWLSARGVRHRLPITPANSGVIAAIGPGENLINQGSSAVDSRGRLHMAFYSNDPNGIPQYQHMWFDGAEWRRSFVSYRSVAFNLQGGGTLQIPMSRPEILIDSNDMVYVFYRADVTGDRMVALRLEPPAYQPQDDIRILWTQDLGYSEPIVDRSRWEGDGILSMLIQENSQLPGDEIVETPPEPVYVVDWDIEGAW